MDQQTCRFVDRHKVIVLEKNGKSLHLINHSMKVATFVAGLATVRVKWRQ
jgi:hypothetical protein